jgi:hypothetical protein
VAPSHERTKHACVGEEEVEKEEAEDEAEDEEEEGERHSRH